MVLLDPAAEHELTVEVCHRVDEHPQDHGDFLSLLVLLLPLLQLAPEGRGVEQARCCRPDFQTSIPNACVEVEIFSFERRS